MLIACPSCLSKNRVDEDRLDQGPVCGRCQSELLAPALTSLARRHSKLARFAQTPRWPVVRFFQTVTASASTVSVFPAPHSKPRAQYHPRDNVHAHASQGTSGDTQKK